MKSPSVVRLVAGAFVLVVAACSSSPAAHPSSAPTPPTTQPSTRSSTAAATNGGPAYPLAKAKSLLVTPHESGLPTWHVKVPPGEQESDTTIALEFLSRSAYSPSTTVSLVVTHSEAVARLSELGAASGAEQDLRDPRTARIDLTGAHRTTRATELTGYDTVLKIPQITITFVLGPVLASVNGADAAVVRRVADAQAGKLAAAG